MRNSEWFIKSHYRSIHEDEINEKLFTFEQVIRLMDGFARFMCNEQKDICYERCKILIETEGFDKTKAPLVVLNSSLPKEINNE